MRRAPFLDVARALAVVLMTFAHVSDSLVRPSEWATGFGRAYALTRGTTAPLFLLVAGWAFALATLSKRDELRRPSRALLERLSRILTLAMWGGVLTIPWWHPGFPGDAPEDAWVAFFSLSPLQLVATTLLLAHGLVLVARSERQLLWLMVAAAVLFVGLAPWVFDATASWPLPLRSPFNGAAYPAGFPLFPAAGFFFVGAAAGIYTSRAQWSAGRVAALLFAVAAVALVVATVSEPAVSTWLGPSYGFVGVSLVLRRLGLTVGALAVLAVATPRLPWLTRLAKLPSRHALTFYVGHMAILWGTPWFLGLHHASGPTQSWLGVAGATAALLGVQALAVASAPVLAGRVEGALARARGWLRGRPREAQAA